MIIPQIETTIKTPAKMKPIGKIAGIFIVPLGLMKIHVCQREHTECMLKITQSIKKGPKPLVLVSVTDPSVFKLRSGFVDLCRGLMCRGVNTAISSAA